VLHFAAVKLAVCCKNHLRLLLRRLRRLWWSLMYVSSVPSALHANWLP